MTPPPSSSPWSVSRASRTSIPPRSAEAWRSAPRWPGRWRLDPEILFLDEPSTGLDPINARLLDDLILDLRDGLGTTVVVVTHDLASIQAIGDNAVFLDSETKTMMAQGTRRPCWPIRRIPGSRRSSRESRSPDDRRTGCPMSKRVRTHPAAIGAFVAGAVALAIAATLIFGASGKLFGRKFSVVMFFDDSVNGLAVGAPVAYRGIRLGQVTQIKSVVGSPRIAVAATLERGPFLTPDNPTGAGSRCASAMEEAIAQGLARSAGLAEPAHRSPLREPRPAAGHPQRRWSVSTGERSRSRPSRPSWRSSRQDCRRVPLVNVPKHLYDTVEGSARLLQSPDLGKALESVGPLVADAQTLLKRLDREVGPLITSLKATSDTARASLVDITQQAGSRRRGCQPADDVADRNLRHGPRDGQGSGRRPAEDARRAHAADRRARGQAPGGIRYPSRRARRRPTPRSATRMAP